MGSFSIWHWLIVLVIVLLLFGRNKIPQLMGDMAKGVNAFKKGLNDDPDSASAKSQQIDQAAQKPAEKPAENETVKH